MSLEIALPTPSLPIPLIDGLPFSPVVASTLGWLACAVLLAALSSRLPWPKGCRDNTWLFAGLGVLTLLPFGEHPGLAAGLHGVTGTVSGTLLQLSLLTLFNRPWPKLPGRRTFLLLLVAALVFYALSLGAGRTLFPDPYAWGYQPQGLLLGVLMLGGWLYFTGAHAWLLILTVDVWLWGLGMHESHNLWDVLFDPILWGLCAWQVWRPARTQ